MTTAEQTGLAKKQVRVQAWLRALKLRNILCYKGECYSSADLGGQYIAEPGPDSGFSSNQVIGNWCGPASGTNVILHWNANAVNNHAAVAAYSDKWTWTTYYGGQAYMAWFATQIPLSSYGRNGVSIYQSSDKSKSPYWQGAYTDVLTYGLNQVVKPIWGSDYYSMTAVYNQNDMSHDAQFDLAIDGNPVIYNSNTNYLTGWNSNLNIGHFVEGYGFSTTNLSYADSMWTSLQGSPEGDHTISAFQMWEGVDHLKDGNGTPFGYIIY